MNIKQTGGNRMRLRDHPKLKWYGLRSWPPLWGGSYGIGQKFAIGEVGVLKDVQFREAFVSMPPRLNIVIEYEGGTHSALLLLEDVSFMEPLYRRLRECIGLRIHEIGDSETDSKLCPIN